jgi:hypothetical protein
VKIPNDKKKGKKKDRVTCPGSLETAKGQARKPMRPHWYEKYLEKKPDFLVIPVKAEQVCGGWEQVS